VEPAGGTGGKPKAALDISCSLLCRRRLELNPGEVKWPEEAKSILTVAVEHPEDKPPQFSII
jgi:hypothetical protein